MCMRLLNAYQGLLSQALPLHNSVIELDVGVADALGQHGGLNQLAQGRTLSTAVSMTGKNSVPNAHA